MNKDIKIFLIILSLGLVIGCGINPLGPSFDQLEKEHDLMPLSLGAQWVFSTAGGETLTWTVSDSFQADGREIFVLLENSAADTSIYNLSHGDRGIDFYNLGVFNPFIKYPLVEGYNWEFSTGINYYYFFVDDPGTEMGEYEDVVMIEWEIYKTFPSIYYDHSRYLYFQEDKGPVAIGEDEKMFLLKESE